MPIWALQGKRFMGANLFQNARWDSGAAVACMLATFQIHAATITSCNQAGLQAAASAGGTYNFTCGGIINLSTTLIVSNDLTLDGTGQNVSISGNNTVRIFSVRRGAQLTLVNLGLINGRYVGTNGANGSPAQPGEPANGGAILIDDGTVNLFSCVLSNNSVVAGIGGNDSSISNLQAGVGGRGQGGAIYVSNGILNATKCTFSKNQAMGGAGGYNMKDDSFVSSGESFGGAVCN